MKMEMVESSPVGNDPKHYKVVQVVMADVTPSTVIVVRGIKNSLRQRHGRTAQSDDWSVGSAEFSNVE
jgi:hypothetical protein